MGENSVSVVPFIAGSHASAPMCTVETVEGQTTTTCAVWKRIDFSRTIAYCIASIGIHTVAHSLSTVEFCETNWCALV